MPTHGSSPNGGYSPPPAPGYGGGYKPGDPRVFGKGKPVQEITKEIGFVASDTDSNQVLSISQTDSSTAVKSGTPNRVVVQNVGSIPTIAIFVYEEYSDSNTDVGNASLQTVLMPC